MKKFAITFVQRNLEGFTPAFCEEVEGDDLLEVVSKFILIIARASNIITRQEYERNLQDDDIPF